MKLVKLVLKIPRILDLENVIFIFAYDFANIGMKTEVNTISQYFYVRSNFKPPIRDNFFLQKIILSVFLEISIAKRLF